MKKKSIKLKPKIQITQNFPIFKVFMQLLSKFRQTSRIGMLKTVIKVTICCAEVSYEEITVVFKLKKFSNWQRKTKNPKFSNFQSFCAGFVKFMTDFVDWKVKKGQQGSFLLSSRLFRRVNCGSQVGKNSNWHRI